MNWGGIAGGFAQGFSNGARIGGAIKEAQSQKELEDARMAGIEEAKKMRASAVDGLISEAPAAAGLTAQPGAEGQMVAEQGIEPAPKSFRVGERTFATREEAMAEADKKAPDLMTYMTKTLVPKMQQVYIQQGDIEKANAWEKWSEDRSSKAAMKEWAGAFRASQLGNFEKASDHIFNLYKQYDDGITPLSKETVKDKEGNITGFNVRLKNEASGEETTQFIDRKALTELGLSALSPQSMFEMAFKRQNEAEKSQAEAAVEDRKARRNQGFELEKISLKEQLERSGAGAKEMAKVNAKVKALKDAGHSQEFIDGNLPGIIGVGNYKKSTSPEEARRQAFSDRIKSDPRFGRLDPAKQREIIDKDMELIFGGKPGSKTPPAANGLPTPGTNSGGIPVYDSKTGEVVYR